jgi:hypothetical protein
MIQAPKKRGQSTRRRDRRPPDLHAFLAEADRLRDQAVELLPRRRTHARDRKGTRRSRRAEGGSPLAAGSTQRLLVPHSLPVCPGELRLCGAAPDRAFAGPRAACFFPLPVTTLVHPPDAGSVHELHRP